MTQPIDSYRTDPWRAVRDDEDSPPAVTKDVPPRGARDASELPALPDVHGDLLARATRSASAAATSPRPLLAGLIEATAIVREMTPTQKRLDDFLESARPTFHTPEGDVTVSIGFRMNLRDGDTRSQRSDGNARALGASHPSPFESA